MNEFEGLLPTRAAPPVLPDRGGPVAIVRAARLRRRRRATRVGAGSAACLAVAGLLLLPGHGTQSLDPVNPPTATPSPGATAPVPDPGGTGATPSPGAPGSRSGSGSGGTAGGPAAGPRAPGRPADATAEPSGKPGIMTTSDGPGQGPYTYVEIDRFEIADPGGGPCEVFVTNDQPPQSLCGRYRGPRQARSGVQTDLPYDVCVSADTVLNFPQKQELIMDLQSAAGGWNAVEPGGHGVPHSETLRAGRCFRYVVHFPGRYPSGAPMATGTYTVNTSVSAGTRYPTARVTISIT
jgi:hypothetical protein